MVDISKHNLLAKCYELGIAIERCGASEELTDATTRCSDLMLAIDKHLEQYRVPDLWVNELLRRLDCRLAVAPEELADCIRSLRFGDRQHRNES